VAAFGVCGAVSVAAQFALARVTLVSLSGNELGTGLFLSFWLLFGGSGSFLLSHAARRHRWSPTAFPMLLLILGLLIPAGCYWIVIARRLLFGPSFSLSMPQTVALASCAAFPVSFVVGGLFGVAIYTAGMGPRIPRALYLADAMGSFAGGLLASFLLAPLLPTLRLALAASAVVLLAGAIVAIRLELGLMPAGVCFAACLIAGTLFTVPGIYARLDAALARQRFPDGEIVVRVDSRYQSFAVVRSHESLSFYQDGVLTFFSQAGEREEEIAHLSLLSRHRPGKVLLIGGGWPFLAREILKHPVESLDLIVEDQKVHEAGMKALPIEQRSFMADPRLRIRYGDLAAILRQTGERYGAAFIDVGMPDTLFAVRFFSRQFLMRLRGLLDDGGIVVLAAPSVQSYLSRALLSFNASLLATLKDAFGAAVVIPSEYAGNVFIAGADIRPEQFQPSRLAAVLDERKIGTRWVNRYSLATILDSQKMTELNERIGGTAGILNTLENPVLLLFSIEYREELSAGLLSLSFLRGFRLWHVAAGFLALVFALSAIQRFVRRDCILPGCAAAIGFSGMVAELALLCTFQLVAGNLYEAIAGLVGFFMAGLALGSVTALAVAKRAGWIIGERWHFTAFLLGLGASTLSAVVVPRILAGPSMIFGAGIGLAIILAGLGSGLSVSLLLEARSGLIYGADLVGGALGGALASVLFLPVVGITRSLWLPVLGYGGGLLLLCGRKLRRRSGEHARI
jgi:spermidine synthase